MTGDSGLQEDGPEEGEVLRRRIYGRHLSTRLSPVQKARLEHELPPMRLTLEDAGRPENLPGPLWLEIGFGGGEHLAAQAEAHPDVTLIGVEPFVAGVVKLLQHIDERDLNNVRVMVDDARLLLSALPEASIERCFILFPDPWPKKRHWKRRIVHPEVLALLARVIQPRGLLRIATDHADYGRWILDIMLRSDDFVWLANTASDWRERSADWPATRYEQKALEAGRQPLFFSFERCS